MYAKPMSAGDSALIVELGNDISEECNEKMLL